VARRHPGYGTMEEGGGTPPWLGGGRQRQRGHDAPREDVVKIIEIDDDDGREVPPENNEEGGARKTDIEKKKDGTDNNGDESSSEEELGEVNGNEIERSEEVAGIVGNNAATNELANGGKEDYVDEERPLAADGANGAVDAAEESLDDRDRDDKSASMDADVTMKVSESASKDTASSVEASGMDAAATVSNGDDGADRGKDDDNNGNGGTTKKKKPLPPPIATAAPKRPRPSHDGEGNAVGFDDDTPKHINIRHPPPGDGGHRKRPRLSSEDARDPTTVTTSSKHHHRYYDDPPDIVTHAGGRGRRSYSIEESRDAAAAATAEEEDRQDTNTAPVTPGGGRQPYDDAGYYYDHRRDDHAYHDNSHHTAHHPHHHDRYHHHHHPPPVISHASSGGGSYPGLPHRGSAGGGGESGGIRDSWTAPGPSSSSREHPAPPPSSPGGGGGGTFPSMGSFGGILMDGGDNGDHRPTATSPGIEPASFLRSMRSMSWEVPAGTLSAIGSTLSFGLQPSLSNMMGRSPVRSPVRSPLRTPGSGVVSPKKVALVDSKKDGDNEDDEDDDEDVDVDFPPLPSTGSLPPRKRAVLAPRPGGPSSKLFEPPRPAHGSRDATGDRGGHRTLEPRTGGGDRVIEARDAPPPPRTGSGGGGGGYPPHIPPPSHSRQPHQPPPIVRSYSYDRHGHGHGGDGGYHGGRYEYDSRYEPPRTPGSYHHASGHHHGSHYNHDPPPPRDHGDAYESPGGRYPPPPHEYSSDGHHHGQYRHHPLPPSSSYAPSAPGSAPWGTPPRNASSGHHPPHRGDNHGELATSSGTAGGGGSFESESDSRKSFRSLDDLDNPEQSLLYRPSFSWERGLDPLPYHHGHHGMPQSQAGGTVGGHGPQSYHHHHHQYGGHHHHGGGGGGPPPPVNPGPSSARAGGRQNDSVGIQLTEQQKIMKALTMRSEIRTIGNPGAPHAGLILLLAMPQDRHCLSETLCIVRNNVEVFTATEADIAAPAPGRKRPIRAGQVGLRCVYCRMCAQRDRVKRATCFPSSMKRIYRAVIDMKLDHFGNCPCVPPGLKARLDQLRAGSTRSTGMTVQYFVRSAREMGMVDMEGDGVCIDLRRVGKTEDAWDGVGGGSGSAVPTTERVLAGAATSDAGYPWHGGYPSQKGRMRSQQMKDEGHRGGAGAIVPHKAGHDPMGPSVPFQAMGMEMPGPSRPIGDPPPLPGGKRYSGQVLLHLPEDHNFLSPLRCFLRRNVCAFTATARDIAVRTPTTFSVGVGQVGVGCIHCLRVPPKARSNRAVCFPFTVGRIYQSVADIQRFHLGECRMMPPDVRAEFLRLQSDSAKGSRGLATRTYWIDSAKKIGLADGPSGMYFQRDPSLPPPRVDNGNENLGILAQAARDANNVGKTLLVTPDDKPTIAEFLYVVMEQLRPCRFTDADRNKRRSKNVGSIGVECKHCAGKIDGRKFFWSSVSAAESNFVSVHSHMLSCKYISEPLREDLARLKALRREQTSKLKTGSQKAFFTRVWARLHGTPVPAPAMSGPFKDGSVGSPKSSISKSPKSSGRKHPKKVHKPVVREAAAIDDQPYPSKIEGRDDDHTRPHRPLMDVIHEGLLHHAHDSDEVRALLESKSTLSSMPSVDESIMKHVRRDGGPDTLDMDLGEGCSSDSADERGMWAKDRTGRTASGEDESTSDDHNRIKSAGSKGSLTSVALNLSAVSVHCKEEQGSNP